MRKALVLPGAQSRQKSGPSPSAASPTVRLLRSVPSPSASTPVRPLMTGPGQRPPQSGAADRHQSTRPCSHRRHHLVVAAVLACLRCVRFVSAAAPAGVGARSPALRTQSASRRTADDPRGCAAQNRKSAPPCRFDRQWGGPDIRRFRKCLLLTIRRWQQRITGMPSRQYKCGQCRLGAPGIPLTVALVCSQIACAAHNDTAIPRYAAADSQPQENRRH